jgi:phospholipid transport system substrate-binding protein
MLCAAAIALSNPAVAQQDSPEALVRTVTNEVVAVLKQDSDIRAGNRRRAATLVEQKVSPHFDFNRMTALAMGANWRKATPEQQQRLVEEFRTLLVRTYSVALTAYRDQAIEVKPGRAQRNDAEAVVRSEVKQPGADAVTIDYSMAKTPAGWKVYDVAIAGASLVATYRESFANEVRTSGLDGLIRSIAAKNQSAAT